LHIEAPEKKRKEKSPVAPLWRQEGVRFVLTQASMRKNAFRELGFGLGPGLTITGDLNFKMVLKKP
jgi:hypothetical protein